MFLHILTYIHETRKHLPRYLPGRLYHQKDYSVKVSYVSCMAKFFHGGSIILVLKNNILK